MVRVRIHSGWLLILLSLLLILLTSLQARGSLLTRGIELVDQSRGHSVFVLRTVSELTALALSATITAAWERVKWAMICRHGSDARFLDFLALDQGTSLLSLLRMSGGWRGPAVETRLWSIARLSSIIIVPVTGVLIMSQVEIQLSFSPEKSQDPYLGYSMHSMNASMAVEYLGFSDLVLSANPASFLHNAARTVNLSPPGERDTFCRLNTNDDGDSGDCHRSYFMAGESLFMTPGLINDASFPKASIILTTNHRGFQLEFDAGDSGTRFNPVNECRTFSSRYWGAPAGAVRLCVGSSGPNELQARVVTCPGTIAARKNCINDTSWHHNVDWTIKMSAYFRNASVAYSRANGTILWHSFHDDSPPMPANITPSDILRAYDVLLLDANTVFAKNGSETSPFSSSNFSTFLWMSQPVFSGQNATNPATVNAVFSGLQALLAIPLYLCQNGVARRLVPMALDAKTVVDAEGLDSVFALLSPLPPTTNPATFAYYRYTVVASTPTLITYLVLSGVTLVGCAVANVLAATGLGGASGTRAGPKLSRFPALDLFTHCSIEDRRHFVIYQGRSGAFQHDAAVIGQMRWLSTLRVRWAGQSAAEDTIQLVGVERRTEVDDAGGYKGSGSSLYLGVRESATSPSGVNLEI
ncbi:hypothetical protein QBC34DRAFT_444245 [Podospora aff. communis PSN243]|uniref:Uncharacterized protein n=1 Tax=Podospora aff. communis PSN243 TaxID=3040156 RepID=A0AAV9G4L2_9PEZI|nr:hypothetical protein QBC34DRAFT_444245 [Podospora aff. communis PSN243]